MKPGNLQCKVPNPAATRDEDSILRTSNARCAVFYFGSFLKIYVIASQCAHWRGNLKGDCALCES